MCVQVAHVTEDVRFVEADESGRVPHGWAEAQVLASADFAHGSWLWTHLSGGLNYQARCPGRGLIALLPACSETAAVNKTGISTRASPSLLWRSQLQRREYKCPGAACVWLFLTIACGVGMCAGGAPPVPQRVPHALPGHRANRAGHLPGVRHTLPRVPYRAPRARNVPILL